jgi:hypothetical protein
MIKNHGNLFNGVRVQLDNNEFIGCKFENCILEYSGSAPVALMDCEFTNVRWEFSGAAQATLNFLRALYHGMGDGGQVLVETTFESIRQPRSGNGDP